MTRIKAVNNKDRNFTRASLTKFIELADANLGDYLQRLDQSDAAESKTGGSRVKNLAEKIAAIREMVPYVPRPQRGEQRGAFAGVLVRAPDLTILNVVWGARQWTLPHNHHHRAIIGMYGGGEDNIFWRRLPEDAKGRVEAAGAASLRHGDVTGTWSRDHSFRYQPLGQAVIRAACLRRRFPSRRGEKLLARGDAGRVTL